ncbi:hypothetical protein [Rhodothermus marinus]|uniref:hypothetical protein n=1 Tax=Rhodothermus marinus TaxID=29549 RepID=UPI001374CDB0|nr:hypothetical protein [Rhodothermus marinus]
MSRWFQYGIQSIAAGLAALLLTGTLHLLTPACAMPIRDVTPPVACATMPDIQAHPNAPTSEPVPCCNEEQPLLSTRQPVSSCCNALGTAKSRLPVSTPRPLRPDRARPCARKARLPCCNALGTAKSRLPVSTPRPLRAPAASPILTVTPPVPLHVQFAVLLI